MIVNRALHWVISEGVHVQCVVEQISVQRQVTSGRKCGNPQPTPYPPAPFGCGAYIATGICTLKGKLAVGSSLLRPLGQCRCASSKYIQLPAAATRVNALETSTTPLRPQLAQLTCSGGCRLRLHCRSQSAARCEVAPRKCTAASCTLALLQRACNQV